MASTRSADTRRRYRSTLQILVAGVAAFVALLTLAQPAASLEVGASVPASQTVGPPAPPPAPPAPPSPAPVPPGQLAYTGSTTWVLGVVGAAFVLSGCALVAAGRRRSRLVVALPSPATSASSAGASPCRDRGTRACKVEVEVHGSSLACWPAPRARLEVRHRNAVQGGAERWAVPVRPSSWSTRARDGTVAPRPRGGAPPARTTTRGVAALQLTAA